ncbi:MAG: tetratricopeptide repeat protein [bacterium]|nr:tetratricopeptide repeat protein [bacterium]
MMVNFKCAALALVLILVGVAGAQAGQDEGSFWYAIDHMTSADVNAEAIVWVTLPPDWHGQEIEITNIDPEPVAILEDKATGNRVIEWLYRPGEESLPMNQFFHYDFKLKQKEIAFDVDPEKVGAYDRNDADFKAFTKAETWIQTDGVILDAAREIIGREKNPWLQSQALFDYCLSSLNFVPGGYGNRDAISTLQNRKGDCGQYSRLFVALCRSIGIPSRSVTNAWLGGGTHVFAEVLLTGYGWVPLDISLAQMLEPGGAGFSEAEVKSFMAERDVPLGDSQWFVGNLFSSRIVVTVGNNISFHSPTLDQKMTFQVLRPGGKKAYPSAVEINGFNKDLIHGGFFVFGQKIESNEEAHKMTHMRLANSFFDVDLFDVVEEGCRKSLNKYSDGVQPWINMGKVYMHKGEYYKAEASFKKAMRGTAARRNEKLEALVWTHNYLGNCYDLLNHRDMALEEYNAVIQMNNNFRGAVDYARKYLKKPFTKTQ